MSLDCWQVSDEGHITDHDARNACCPAHERKDSPPSTCGAKRDPWHRRHQSKGRPFAQFRDRKALHSECRRDNHQNSDGDFANKNQNAEPDGKKVVVHRSANADKEDGAIGNRVENLAQFAHLLEPTSNVTIDPVSRGKKPEEPAAGNHTPIGEQTHERGKHGEAKERQRIRYGQIFTDTHNAMVAPGVVRDREWT